MLSERSRTTTKEPKKCSKEGKLPSQRVSSYCFLRSNVVTSDPTGRESHQRAKSNSDAGGEEACERKADDYLHHERATAFVVASNRSVVTLDPIKKGNVVEGMKPISNEKHTRGRNSTNASFDSFLTIRVEVAERTNDRVEFVEGRPNLCEAHRGADFVQRDRESHDFRQVRRFERFFFFFWMTLLLGPPGSGKTTLLSSLAGKAIPPLKITGNITYNGFKLEDFVPEKIAAYINQHDLHISQMTVRETLDFAARCQGVGDREDLIREVARREKQAGIIPDPVIDTYMKGISIAGLQTSLQTDYILKILGLDICSETKVGDTMRRGISGVQKRRLTTGEMMVGPTRALFMDEISNRLDSSTTFQIISCIQQLVHIMEATSLISLLQPAAETFNLFDDIILMSEGKIIYHGPRDRVLHFFQDCGFICPKRKGIADFLQELSSENMTLGQQILKGQGLDFKNYFYWLSIGALFGFTLLLNIGIAMALTYSNNPRNSKATISKQQPSLQKSGEVESKTCAGHIQTNEQIEGRMVIPFKQLTMTFKNVQYFIDTPKEMRDRGFGPKRLQLLQDITGTFRPGILTALMGVSGAGKTTLMDVLCGRKTDGIIEGDIRIGGYPKIQETFVRISGYCEQNDIHSPQITIKESLMFSTSLRLPPNVDRQTRAVNLSCNLQDFVDAVLETVELDGLRDALVGIPGINGLSTEQRKRLTIAVELVANPSILFMDEPTSGVDARSAATVMRAVKNIAEMGRTVICTIHQPSIDIFESFDEVCLMKRGGQVIYFGALSKNSKNLIEYFERIQGIPKIKHNYNPATWMLEVTSTITEENLGIDFVQLYKESTLYQHNERDIFSIMGSMYLATVILGIMNSVTVLPIIAREREVLYRERFAGMYSCKAYAFAQVVVEIPCTFTLVAIYVISTYPTIGYYWSVYKIIWYFYTMFCALLYFNYMGMLMMSLSRSTQVASVLLAACCTMLNLFSGFLMPKPHIPKWWIWLYWICPTSWTLNSLLTSQYGDVTTEIIAFGETKTVTKFLTQHYGFHPNQSCLVAFVIACFPLIFASLFFYYVGKLNFQRR
ncbi:hypothetical protein M5K25_001515 [Dendrobium thyrsiflorum]|uniref:ABC transporter domain-containing protein n=1 Tax=Dendrobium thyrsiflorum TaxID=117978 RepID=A0ABD0W014_DENTH